MVGYLKIVLYAGGKAAIVTQKFDQIREEFTVSESVGTPKHLRLKNAILTAIRKGKLKPGDQLPPEIELSNIVGLSLGTVQRALNALASDQAVTREQGRGTFVAKATLARHDLWQYRFVSCFGDDLLPTSVEFVSRRITHDRQSWSDVLGFDEGGYCELTRLVTVNDDLQCLSKFYVRNTRFPTLSKMPRSAISVNLKQFFAQKLNVFTNSVDQYVQACEFEKDVCAGLRIRRGFGTALLSVGRTATREAITFQSLFIPRTSYLLKMAPAKRPAEFRFGTIEDF